MALKRAFWTYMVALLFAMATIPLWAPRTADPEHPVPFRMRNGQVFYVHRWVGRAIDLAFPVAGVLLVGLAFVGWQNRGLLERYDHGAG